MASWTPVPLANFDDDEDAKTVLISRRAQMAWEDVDHDADATTPAAVPTREEQELVAYEADGSLDQSPPRTEPGAADGLFSPWVLAMVIGMSLPIALAAAAYLMA